MTQRIKSITTRFSQIMFLVVFSFSVHGKSKDKPRDELFSAFPDSKVEDVYTRHWDKYVLVTGLSGKSLTTDTIFGQIKRYDYVVAKSHSEENILNNYIKAIKDKGGEILFSCKETGCGDGKALIKIIDPLNNISKNNVHFVSAKFNQKGAIFYVSILVKSWQTENNLQLDIIEIKDEPYDLLTVKDEYLNTNPKEVKIGKLDIDRDTKGSSDHPLISRLPGSRIRDQKHLGYEKNQLVNQIIKGNYGSVEVNGKTTVIEYEVPREYSELEAIENYKKALAKAGFIEQFSCEGRACGKKKDMTKAIRSLVSIGGDDEQRYILAKLTRPEGNIWASVYVIGYIGRLGVNLHIVEEKALNDSRLSVDVDAIHQAIESKGHIALDGILFEFDSDNLLPESLSVVDQVALYIKREPDKLFYIVGHTDDKGKRSYNSVLSTRRAEKIIQLLVGKGIKQKQLTAEGVGEYVPVANNSSEEGRQLNRRVELVLRSDNL